MKSNVKYKSIEGLKVLCGARCLGSAWRVFLQLKKSHSTLKSLKRGNQHDTYVFIRLVVVGELFVVAIEYVTFLSGKAVVLSKT